MYGNISKLKSTRQLTFAEELANSITHGISSLGVLIFIPVIGVILTNANVSLRDFIGVMIFLVSILMMFIMSTIYHIVKAESPAKIAMRKLDHSFIFVAIAGSYTPIALTFLWNIPGYGRYLSIIVICIQWGSVIAGILFKTLSKGKLNASLPLYLGMGWTLIFVFPLFIKYQNIELFWFLVIGGLFYSLGVIFFAFKRIKYTHMLWHFFVSFGALFHIIGICFYLCL